MVHNLYKIISSSYMAYICFIYTIYIFQLFHSKISTTVIQMQAIKRRRCRTTVIRRPYVKDSFTGSPINGLSSTKKSSSNVYKSN